MSLPTSALHTQEAQFKKGTGEQVRLPLANYPYAIDELQLAWDTATWELAIRLLIALAQLNGFSQSELQFEHPLVQAKLSSLNQP